MSTRTLAVNGTGEGEFAGDGRRVYLLAFEGFDPLDILPEGLHPYGDRALYLIHLVLTRSWMNRGEAGSEGVPLKAEYLRNTLGKGYADSIKKAMLEAGVIINDGIWVPGRKSIAYDLNWSWFAGMGLKWVKVRDETLRRNLLALRRGQEVQASATRLRLVDKLAEIGVDAAKARAALSGLALGPGDDPDRIESWKALNETMLMYMEHEDRAERCFVIQDKYGRMHHILSNAPSGMRGHCSYGGSPLVNVDIANSQPLIAGSVIRDGFRRDLPRDVIKYIEVCEAGKLYEELMAKAETDKDRGEFKRDVFVVFYGQGHHMRGPVADAFRELYPNVFRAIREDKAERGHASLAHRMQGRESELVIDGDGGAIVGAAARFMAEAPEAPIVTIHDSILTTAEYAGMAEWAIKQEFAKLGIRPDVKTQRCDPRLVPKPVKDDRRTRKAG